LLAARTIGRRSPQITRMPIGDGLVVVHLRPIDSGGDFDQGRRFGRNLLGQERSTSDQQPEGAKENNDANNFLTLDKNR
jgi:hypothetical protein